MLQELTSIPEGLLGLPADQLEAVLGGPVLIHLPGKRPAPLFLSVLMHGNETVGWEAVRRLLKRYEGGRDLPRAISLFIGNVSAAALGLRRLPGQPDYNRVWPGCETDGSPEHVMMRRVTEIISRLKPFASVDVHNNTGLNPHYACVNRLDASFLHLANLFGRTAVYFLRPKGVQSMALAEICPAVTLECGKVGQARGVDHALEYLDACLHLSEHPAHPVADQDIDLFHTVAQVKVPETLSFSFGDWEADILFAPDLDHMNFRELPRGTSLGRVLVDRRPILDARDERGEDVTARFFAVEEGELRLRTPVMPSMLTTNKAVVRQDCLCYLMERYDTHLHERD
ncbi:MAG: succinylglutamate desuccinylase/aspartoacylase family protein [gamma proteobacterium endosymbiont of Lamellibrachia anaximandri]|nr:succinylglutamate desuccinylase/aspartoacylase family protein [gamma proteobacterium endosymbiont of Lamellibrachia anaximandri]MBL3532666.1 succinylglutamate desuccinylase/aspartoacylase family protein [gamma proteobacterium endosymbiont of Lamellibrachia anaximandri]